MRDAGLLIGGRDREHVVGAAGDLGRDVVQDGQTGGLDTVVVRDQNAHSVTFLGVSAFLLAQFSAAVKGEQTGRGSLTASDVRQAARSHFCKLRFRGKFSV